MTNERQDRIRQRAHEIWEREGRPHGKHDDHWQQAREEIEREGDGTGAAPEGGTAKARKPRGASSGKAGEVGSTSGRRRQGPREVTSEGTKPDGAPPAQGNGTALGTADAPAGRRRRTRGAAEPEASAKPTTRARKGGSEPPQDA